MTELDRFIHTWDAEAAKTARILASIPADKYDFKPDAEGRSLGELAWHLAESDTYAPFSIERGEFSFGVRPPGIERPKTIEEMAPKFQRLHEESVARVRKLEDADLDRTMQFFTGPMTIRDLLWNVILFHQIHHRGQLSLLIRLAGSRPAGMYGPVREEMAALRASMAK